MSAGLGLEGAVEEVGGGLVGGQPVLVEEEAVEFVGEDEFFDGDVAGAQGLGEDGGLGVGDVGVVVAVDEEDGRAPAGRWTAMGELARALAAMASCWAKEPCFQSEALSSRFQSWTPWKSTPAAKRSELRARASAVR